MKKFTLNINGKGAECFVHRLTPEQKTKLNEINDQLGEKTYSEISSILNINNIHDTELLYLGPYHNSESVLIEVKNESDEVIWKSNNDYFFIKKEFMKKYYDEDVFIFQESYEGEFYSYDLEIENDFDFNKINLMVTDLSQVCEIITELSYDEIQLFESK